MKVIFIIDSLEGYGAEKSIVEIALRMQHVVPVFINLYGEGNLTSKLEKKAFQFIPSTYKKPMDLRRQLIKLYPL